MKATTPNRLERLLAAAAQDTSQRRALMEVLVEEALWFPVAYHPELPKLVRPKPDEHVPFWIGQDDEGPFIPIFTSRAALTDGLRRFTKRYAVATMKGSDLCAAAARQGHAIRLNPGAKFTGSFRREVVRQIASGELLAETEPMHLSATVRPLEARLLPEALVKAALEECEAQPDILALWIGDLGGREGIADLHHLHAVVLLRDAARTPIDDLYRVLRLALPGKEIEMIRFDEAGSPEALSNIRKYPAIFSRPGQT